MKWEIRAIFSGGHPMLELRDSGAEAWELAGLWLKDSRYHSIVIAYPPDRRM